MQHGRFGLVLNMFNLKLQVQKIQKMKNKKGGPS